MCLLRPLALFLLLFTFVPAHAGHKPPQVFLHINVQTNGEGLGPGQATTISLPPSGEIIQIRAIPEVTEKDLIDVKTDASGTVFLFLNHRGKVSLDAATGQNQGRILVVTINGYVVYSPVIDQQITNGVIAIPHPLPAELVKLLQDIAQKNVRESPH